VKNQLLLLDRKSLVLFKVDTLSLLWILWFGKCFKNSPKTSLSATFTTAWSNTLHLDFDQAHSSNILFLLLKSYVAETVVLEPLTSNTDIRQTPRPSPCQGKTTIFPLAQALSKAPLMSELSKHVVRIVQIKLIHCSLIQKSRYYSFSPLFYIINQITLNSILE
jgi:hypothetical protein